MVNEVFACFDVGFERSFGNISATLDVGIQEFAKLHSLRRSRHQDATDKIIRVQQRDTRKSDPDRSACRSVPLGSIRCITLQPKKLLRQSWIVSDIVDTFGQTTRLTFNLHIES